jgi:hypothetical protein
VVLPHLFVNSILISATSTHLWHLPAANNSNTPFSTRFFSHHPLVYTFLYLQFLNMASSSDPTPSKKRIGRKRKPPLAPGPSIQFVVASHPDEFKDCDTMRNVRSHVMYKHREQRGSSPSDKRKSREGSSTPAITPRTPSPMTTTSDGVLEDNNFLAPSSARRSGTVWNDEFYNYTSGPYATDPMRTLAARIISATTAAPARSAPPMFEGALQFPFPEHNVLTQDSLSSLKQDYINSTEFFCHGML